MNDVTSSFSPSVNEKDIRALAALYRQVRGTEAAADHQRQALFLIAYTNPVLGNFKLDQTAGLFCIDKKIPRHWAKNGLGGVIAAADKAKFAHKMQTAGTDAQGWRIIPHFNEALQELGVIARSEPAEVIPQWQSEPDTLISLYARVGRGMDRDTMTARQALVLLAYEVNFKHRGYKAWTRAAELLGASQNSSSNWDQEWFLAARKQMEAENFKEWRKIPAYQAVLGKLNALAMNEKAVWTGSDELGYVYSSREYSPRKRILPGNDADWNLDDYREEPSNAAPTNTNEAGLPDREPRIILPSFTAARDALAIHHHLALESLGTWREVIRKGRTANSRIKGTSA